MEAKIAFQNLEEFQELLKRAATLSQQLNETLQQVNQFELDIEAIAGKVADELSNKIERTVSEISDSDF